MAPIRSSKFRHVFGDPKRKEQCHDNIRLTKNAFDSNLAKSNGKYVSLNWEASGGGSFAVIPTAQPGKLPDRFPLFDGHKGAVLDTDWNPFDEQQVVSASDDGTIGVWSVPTDFTVYAEFEDLDSCPDVHPEKFLKGHSKKVGHVHFNPVARDVLASASLDNTIKVWNVATGEVLFTLKHPAMPTSFAWSFDGTQIASVAKDRRLRVWDVRSEKVVSEGKGHAGAKSSRVVWLGDRDRILTTGFSLISDREMAIWNTTNIEAGPINDFRRLDPSSGVVIPHYDEMTSIVYLGGRGDGKIVYYQYDNDELHDLFAYNSTSPQRGLGWAPGRSLDPHTFEVARAYKVHEQMVEPISFKVPLKSEGMLPDVYTWRAAGVPAMTAEEFAAGKTARPLVQKWTESGDAEPEPAPRPQDSGDRQFKVNPEVSRKSDAQVEAKSAETKLVEAKVETKADTAKSANIDGGSTTIATTGGEDAPKKAGSVAKVESSVSELKGDSGAVAEEPRTSAEQNEETEKPAEKAEETVEKSKTLDEKPQDESVSDAPERAPKVAFEEKAVPPVTTTPLQSASTAAAQSAAAEELAALSKAENQDSNKVLYSEGVKTFLAKNAEAERDVSDHDSIWDSDVVDETEASVHVSVSDPAEKPAEDKADVDEAVVVDVQTQDPVVDQLRRQVAQLVERIEKLEARK